MTGDTTQVWLWEFFNPERLWALSPTTFSGGKVRPAMRFCSSFTSASNLSATGPRFLVLFSTQRPYSMR